MSEKQSECYTSHNSEKYKRLNIYVHREGSPHNNQCINLIPVGFKSFANIVLQGFTKESYSRFQDPVADGRLALLLNRIELI